MDHWGDELGNPVVQAQLRAEQPLPRAGTVGITRLVIADLLERERVGIQTYGTTLQAHNGRDALLDAYEEALDLAQYLRQALVEREEGCCCDD